MQNVLSSNGNPVVCNSTDIEELHIMSCYSQAKVPAEKDNKYLSECLFKDDDISWYKQADSPCFEFILINRSDIGSDKMP